MILIYFALFVQGIFGQYESDETQKINLEDIEADNLINERFIVQDRDPLVGQSTQHLRPPGILAVNSFILPENGGVVYATPATEDIVSTPIVYTQTEHDDERVHHSQTQYVTPSGVPEYQEHHYNTIPVYGATPHDPTYTYTTVAAGRQLKPNLAVAGLLHRQPEQDVVYVQERNNPTLPQLVSNDVQYVTQSPSPIIYNHNGGQQVDEPKYSPQHHSVLPATYAPAATYLQYIPYVARGPNNGQSYIMMAPIPAGYGQTTGGKTIIAYSHGNESPIASEQPIIQYVQRPVAQQQSGIQYVGNNDIEELRQPVQPHPHPLQVSYAPQYITPVVKSPEKMYSSLNYEKQPAAPGISNHFLSYTQVTEKSKDKSSYSDKKAIDVTPSVVTYSHSVNNVKDEYAPEQPPYETSSTTSKDIVYVTSTTENPQNIIPVDVPNQRSKQQQYAPEHRERALSQSKSANNINFASSSNRFQSFPSTTDGPRYQQFNGAASYAQQYQPGRNQGYKQQQQQQQQLQLQQQQYKSRDHRPTNFGKNQQWIQKVMPLQQEQYQKFTRISTPRPLIASTPSPFYQSSTISFQNDIPKLNSPPTKSFEIQRSRAQTIQSQSQKPFRIQQQQTQNFEGTIKNQLNTEERRKFIDPISNQQRPVQATPDPFANRQAKSLLDSYIPSWIIVQNQNPNQSRQFPQNQLNYEKNAITNSYNTIAYSVPHNQLGIKRSTTKLLKVNQ